MTNEEAIVLIGSIQFDLTDGYYQREDYTEALCVFDRLNQENAKLKAEIEQLKWKLSSTETQRDLKGYDAKRNADIMSSQLKIIKQLKSELEQSVKLPYLAGTPLYFAFSKQGIIKDKIRRWQINEHGILFCSKGSTYPVEFIGKYAFLTREEAEQSLKGVTND